MSFAPRERRVLLFNKLSKQDGRPASDGIASIIIGLIPAVTATVSVQETKGLLIGERARQGILNSSADTERACRG